MKKKGTLLIGTIITIILLFAGCDPGLTDIQPNSDKDITNFCFKAAKNPGFSTDLTAIINDLTISILVPYETDVTALVATFIINGTGVAVGSTTQTSGTTANNFTSSVTYTVTVTIGLPSREFLIQMIQNEQDVTSVDTSGITDMSYMFYN